MVLFEEPKKIFGTSQETSAHIGVKELNESSPSDSTQSQPHMYIHTNKPKSTTKHTQYIHTFMEKRVRERDNNNTVTTNVIFYDKKDMDDLKLIAHRHNTNVSSIVSNLVREFVALLQSETPQKTLFNFDEKPKIAFDTDIREAESFLVSCSEEEYKEWCRQLQDFLNLDGRLLKKR